MKQFKKADLKTGMFGVKTDGALFVVVGGRLVYQDGGYDEICEMNDAMEFKSYFPGRYNRIEKLCSACCFNQAKRIFADEPLLYDRRIAEQEE